MTRIDHLGHPEADLLRHGCAAELAVAMATSRDDDALYFFRLALAHEDMHHEAALYMARHLGLPIGDARWQAPRLAMPCERSPGAPAPPALSQRLHAAAQRRAGGVSKRRALTPCRVASTCRPPAPVRWRGRPVTAPERP